MHVTLPTMYWDEYQTFVTFALAFDPSYQGPITAYAPRALFFFATCAKKYTVTGSVRLQHMEYRQ